jgi:hypothetical protein
LPAFGPPEKAWAWNQRRKVVGVGAMNSKRNRVRRQIPRSERPPLTAERLRERVSYSPETGAFVWIIPPVSNPGATGHDAGCLRKRYRVICIDGVVYQAHRLAWLYVHGSFPQLEIDHINGDPADNKIGNLREVPHALNMQNRRRPHRNNSTGFMGVSFAKGGGFKAAIGISGRTVFLGEFKTAEEAHAAYLAKKREVHPGCTI